MDELRISRLYYSTKEVCEIAKVAPYTLRNWEKKYSVLRPVIRRSGRRLYRPQDLETVMMIKSLKSQGHAEFTIRGPLKGVSPAVPVEPAAETRAEWVRFRQEMVEELTEILELLQGS